MLLLEKSESFLQIIEDYMKKNNINLPFIPVDQKSIPESIKRAIVSEIKLNNPTVDVSKLYFDLVQDSNGFLYMTVSCGNTICLNVLKGWNSYDKRFMFGQKKTEAALLSKATEFDKADYYYATRYVDKRYIRPYNEVLGIDFLAKNTAIGLCNYIGYLQEERDISLKPDVASIEYIEPERILSSIKRVPRGMTTPERKYPLIDMEDRLKVLDSFGPKFIIEATGNRTKELTHRVYSYEMEKNSYCIVVEPVDGDSYTKIFFYQGELDVSIASNIAGYILSLSSSETLDNESICRTKHTTLEMFNNDIAFALNDYYDSVHEYTKKNISLSRTKPIKKDE